MSNKSNISLNILKGLSIEDLSTKDIKSIISSSGRTIDRYLRHLEMSEYIQLLDKEKTGERGAPNNIWRITFFGMLFVLNNHIKNLFSTSKFDDFDKELNNIIKSQKVDWVIFNEWSYLISRDDFKEYILDQMETFFIRYKFMNELLEWEEYPVNRRVFRKHLSEDIYDDGLYFKEILTEYCLGLIHFLDKRYEIQVEDIIVPGGDVWFTKRYLPYLLKNRNIFNFINSQTSVYKNVNERYEKILDLANYVPPYGKKSRKKTYEFVIEDDGSGILKRKDV